jgi:murein DD-endopeptidase MepM/ murein hydrolase activator NlpD
MLERIISFFLRLLGLGGQSDVEVPKQSDAVPTGDDDLQAFPTDQELPSDVDFEAVPDVSGSDTNASVPAQAAEAIIEPESALSASSPEGCRVTVRPQLGLVNIRYGPGLGFNPPLARARGGAAFDLVGATARNPNELRWFALRVGTRTGWIRGDLVEIAPQCLALSFIDREDILLAARLRPPTPTNPDPEEQSGPLPEKRFDPPTRARITQGYRFPAHPGIDMGADEGTPLTTPADGICIRRVDCSRCTDTRPNRFPNFRFQCPDTWRDPAWGFGYGNFIVMRYNYVAVPAPLREVMDQRRLAGAFVYVLYAHLSTMNVILGQQVSAGDRLGETGNTGCSSGPHLHFEVRIGDDEIIDGIWSRQTRVHPNLMFDL